MFFSGHPRRRRGRIDAPASLLREHDRSAVALRLALDRIVVPLAYAAAGVVRTRASRQLGYARLEDHARERFGRSGRWLRDLAKLGTRLSELQPLARALDGRDGERPIGRVAARAVADVASPRTVDVWVGMARELTARELQLAARFARERSLEARASEREPSPSINEGDTHATGTPRSTFSTSAAERRPDDAEVEPTGEPDDRIVRIAVPQPVKAMFDETVDLFRHLEGFEAGAVPLVEALVGEAHAGPAPPEGDILVPGSRTRRPEADPHPAGLPEPVADGAFRLADEDLARFERVAARAGAGGPVDLDAQVRTFLRLEDQLQARLGRLLRTMDRCHAWVPLGFQGLGQYAEERLGIPRRTLQSRARLARQLEGRPLLRVAYERGDLGFEKVRAAVRALGTQPCEREVEQAWVAHARMVTVKRLRDETREIDRRALGLPWRKAVPPLEDAAWQGSLRCEAGTYRRRVRELGRMALQDPRVDVFLRLRVPVETARSFLGAVEARRRMLAEQAGEMHRLLSRTPSGIPDLSVAAGPSCSPAPGATSQASDGPAAGAMSQVCDGPATTESPGSTFSAGEPVRLPSDGDRESPAAQIDTDDMPELPVALLLAHRFARGGAPVPAWVGLVGMLEDFAETWDVEPMRRKFVSTYERDDMRCTAAGCTSRRHLEDHHIVFRSHGGGDEPENQTTGCRFHHHQGAHGRFGACTGSAPLDVRWRLGRREFGAWFRNERLLEDPTLAYGGEIPWWYWRKKQIRAGAMAGGTDRRRVASAGADRLPA